MINNLLNNLLFFYIIKKVGDDMNLVVLICLLIALICIIMIIMIINYNKFSWFITKINKGENNIYSELEQKHSILIRYIDILKENIEIDDNLENYNHFNKKLSINEINKKLNELNNIINKYMDNNEKLLKKENIININKELNEINILINGSKKYYNDNLINYNHLCHKFPSLIIAKIFKYEEKEHFTNITY